MRAEAKKFPEIGHQRTSFLSLPSMLSNSPAVERLQSTGVVPFLFQSENVAAAA